MHEYEQEAMYECVRGDRQEHSQPQQHRPTGERRSFSGKAGNRPSAYIYFVFFRFSFAINTWILKYTDQFCILCFTAVELLNKKSIVFLPLVCVAVVESAPGDLLVQNVLYFDFESCIETKKY